MAKSILTGLAILALAGCGGSGNKGFTYEGRWVGLTYMDGAKEVDILSDKSGQFSGTKGSLPVTGYIGPSQVVFSDNTYANYTIQNGRIEGVYISLGKQ